MRPAIPFRETRFVESNIGQLHTEAPMLTALYYPHTDVRNTLVLKNALLLWDKLETIVPESNWQPYRFADKYSNEAVDLIVSPRKPNDREKTEAHEVLQRKYEAGEIAKLIASTPQDLHRNPYLIYPDKFMRETWRMLTRTGMARWESRYSDYGVPPALGFLMMSLLADACAGTQIQKVTDRGDAYSWLSETQALVLNSTYVRGLDVSQVAPAHDRLVALSLEVLDVRDVPMSRLVAFRKREASGRGADYSAMRRRYLKTLQDHVKRICSEARSKSDVRELERQFKADLSTDLADLKAELKLASIKSLFSKEVAVSAVLTAGAFLSPIAGLTELAARVGWVGVVPLFGAASALRGARRAALLKHTSSWLYLTTRRRGIQLV
jgi:hypothetical protein